MTTTFTSCFICLAVACFIVACSGSDISESEVYTLYRNVPSTPDFRVHVATFDADHFDAEMSELVNSKNCWRAQAMFQGSKEWEG